jgi:isocitrate dehydrogenase (NAD+)
VIKLTYKITLIPGDGIGPDVINAAKMVIEASGVNISWEIATAGENAIKEFGTPLPDQTIESIKRNGIALKGPITTPVGTGFRSVNVGLRQALKLYANVRPVKTFEGVPSRYQDINLVVVRENTEDLYAGIEHMVGEDAAESIKIITRGASERISKYAFDLARHEGYKKVTAVHKANIMKCTDGLFLRCAKNVASEHTDVQFEDVIVDAMCMKLVMYPENYEVLVMPNLYGDIVSDLASGLIGGLGLVPSANIGLDAAIFEPVHGSAPDIAGKNLANPTAAMLSGTMMLKHIGEFEAASSIENAIAEVLKEGKYTTADLGGTCGTIEYAEAVIKAML